MRCLTHVLKFLAVGLVLIWPLRTGATEVLVDVNYCKGLAMLAKATAEAHQRSESINEWKKNLNTLDSYVVKNKDNVLYSVLPKAIQEVKSIYAVGDPPVESYVTSFNACMAEDYGRVVAVR